MQDYDRPLPRDVPGFARAQAAGEVPARPAERPPTSVTPTAARRQLAFAGAAMGAMVLFFVLVTVLLDDGSGLGATVAVGGTGLLMLVGIYRAWVWVGQGALTELHRGYSTVTMMYGGYGWGAQRRFRSSGHRAPWDYSGVWVLTGAVSTAPDLRRDPPGFYPSPHREDVFELWSGQVWTGEVRRRDRLPR